MSNSIKLRKLKYYNLCNLALKRTSQIEDEAEERFGVALGTVRTALRRMQREIRINKNQRGSYDVAGVLFKKYLEGLF